MRHLYPPVCVLCGSPGVFKWDICDDCQQELPLNRNPCQRCALPLVANKARSICGQCLRKTPRYTAAWSPFVYAQPLEWMIHQLKFNAKLAYAPLLAELAITHLPDMDEMPDCIIPVPLHSTRLRQRGYNQAEELARPIAQHLGTRLDTLSCSRCLPTVPQIGLNAKQRRQNIHQAFRFDNASRYHYVVIFDDVMTTGSTMAELTRTIKKQGVRRVDVWGLARADNN